MGTDQDQETKNDCEEDSSKKHPMWKSFLEAGMADPQQDQNMTKGFLPGKCGKSKEEAIGLSDPKPDWIYGMQPDTKWAPGTAPSQRTRELISLGFKVSHPSFVIEGKGFGGVMDEARNQALRDGSALVNARMAFNDAARDTASIPRPVGPDFDSYCFSSTWNTEMAELWVHWYQTLTVGEPGLFHMHLLGEFLTRRYVETSKFRSAVHNILDWMIYVDVPKRKALLPIIKAREDAEVTNRKSAKSSKVSKVSFTPKSSDHGNGTAAAESARMVAPLNEAPQTQSPLPKPPKAKASIPKTPQVATLVAVTKPPSPRKTRSRTKKEQEQGQ
ncbi:hypothetical protein BDR22DRAFT_49340 [Usnea florida]